MRASRLAALTALVLVLAAGCGGDEITRSGSVPEGASFAPTSTAAYIVAVTDVDSEQWRNADDLLKRFPGRAKLLESFTNELEEDNLTWERDVRPALGPDLHAVWLDFANDGENVVGYTKPKDKAKFNKLLECCGETLVHREIDGWTVFAETEALLTRFASERSDDSLGDDDTFTSAMERMPDDSLARAYVSGQQLEAAIERESAGSGDARQFRQLQKSFGRIESLAFATTARDDGVRMDAAFASSEEPKVESFEAELADKFPSSPFAYVAYGDLRDTLKGFLDAAKENVPNFEVQRRQLETALGFSLEDDLFPLFANEGGVAVYKGGEFAYGVTFMLDVEGNEDKARDVVNRIGPLMKLAGGGEATKMDIDGVEVTRLEFAEGVPFELYIGVKDNVLIGSTQELTMRDALDGDSSLADDAAFKAAQEAAEMPDESLGLAYVDVNDTLTFIFDSQEASSGVPPDPEVKANIEPLETALLYGTRDGNSVLLSGFLTIK